ncbi:alpha/beta-hydrolase [Choiromyces venosus 120613-1]|uniref:Alpha/beta-hydrolase n=1 Tax=Choiromyces venosus 120613-1 TaxID=1336337 RepID=A0A3N4K2V9_9PEZI|nr:alpha/beta-hydrolase [Choiromyces venosus 120613-1]
MVHGWPGSFWEFSKIIEPLANPPDTGMPAFNVVVPSIPGYAFSDGPKKPGFGAKKIAEAMDKLMKKLGYEHYVAQGGDWGYLICRYLAIQYPKNVRAIHINLLWVKPPTLSSHPIKFLKLSFAMASNGKFPGGYTPEEVTGLKSTKKFDIEEMGYQAIHKTKPMTLAYGLTDSPVGLLAWMREKMHSWTDNYPWTNDEVLTWFMLYWTPGPHQATRLYKEAAAHEIEEGTSKWSNVPMGFSSFPKEIFMPPSDWANMLHPLKFYRKHNSGGHFAAWEKPEELMNDVRDFFKEIVGKDKVLQAHIQRQHSVSASNGIAAAATVNTPLVAATTNGA